MGFSGFFSDVALLVQCSLAPNSSLWDHSLSCPRTVCHQGRAAGGLQLPFRIRLLHFPTRMKLQRLRSQPAGAAEGPAPSALGRHGTPPLPRRRAPTVPHRKRPHRPGFLPPSGRRGSRFPSPCTSKRRGLSDGGRGRRYASAAPPRDVRAGGIFLRLDQLRGAAVNSRGLSGVPSAAR